MNTALDCAAMRWFGKKSTAQIVIARPTHTLSEAQLYAQRGVRCPTCNQHVWCFSAGFGRAVDWSGWTAAGRCDACPLDLSVRLETPAGWRIDDDAAELRYCPTSSPTAILTRDVLEELARARPDLHHPALGIQAATTALAVLLELEKLDGREQPEARELARRLVEAGRLLPRDLMHLAAGAVLPRELDWNAMSLEELLAYLRARDCPSERSRREGLRASEDATAHRDRVEVRRYRLLFLYGLERYADVASQALPSDIDNATSLLLAWALIRCDRARDAEPHARRAITHERTNPRAYLALAEALWATGDHNAAIGTLAQMVSTCDGRMAQIAKDDAAAFMKAKKQRLPERRP